MIKSVALESWPTAFDLWAFPLSKSQFPYQKNGIVIARFRVILIFRWITSCKVQVPGTW